MSARPIVNRARVLVERLEHTAACIPDLEIQQAFENIRNQWNTLMQRDWLLCQLQAIPQKWCEYETNFEDMVKWMNTVDKSVASMSVDAKSLENFNRLREEFKVQTSITEKLELLLTIQQEVSELLTMQSSANPSEPPLTSQRLLGVDVAGLRNTISQMKVAVQEQSQSVFQDMEHWREYDVQANEVKPWLDDAEKRTAVIITRPSSVSEMESLLNAAHLFEDECKRQLTKLQQMSSHCQQMFNQSSTLRRIGRFAQSMERRPRHGSPAARAPDVRAIPGLFFRLSLASLICFSIRSF